MLTESKEILSREDKENLEFLNLIRDFYHMDRPSDMLEALHEVSIAFAEKSKDEDSFIDKKALSSRLFTIQRIEHFIVRLKEQCDRMDLLTNPKQS